MANEELKAELKEKFSTGSIPSGENFSQLIDALAEDGVDGEDGPRGLQGIPGEDGLQGIPGEDGKQGIPGEDGADGFPTKVQWDSLVERVEALEPAE